MEEIYTCSDLHPDIELGVKRDPQKIFIEIPDSGINDETGLIMFINGFNTDAESDYSRRVLKPHLAGKYNCVVLESNYFGLRTVGQILPSKNLIDNFNYIYSVNIPSDPILTGEDKDYQTNLLLEQMLQELSQRSITSLDPRCQFTIVRKDGGYESWGLLPAVDYLNYVGMILAKYKLNKKKVILYGLGYGGYVAKLMGKFAPHTFSVIIDRSGFSEVKINHIAGHELQEPDYMINLKSDRGEDILFYLSYNNPWTIMDEESEKYFGDPHRSIRSLSEEKHRQPSETRYYCFHSSLDEIAPVGDCDVSVEILKRYNSVHYERVDSSLIGKSIFTSLQHDLGVSTRGLFDHVAGMDKDLLCKESARNDFSMENEHHFDCGAAEYVLKYSMNDRVKMSLRRR